MKPNYIVISLIMLVVALTGSWATSSGMDWYNTINLPAWTPSGSVIGTAWTIIFILSTVSALIVWNTAPHDTRFWWIIGIFLANAFLNVFWSVLFFNQHMIAASIAEMIMLELSVLALVILIWPLSRLASALLMPYAGWVAFATYLAYSVWLLNR